SQNERRKILPSGVSRYLRAAGLSSHQDRTPCHAWQRFSGLIMPFENTIQARVAREHADGVTVHVPLSPAYLNNAGVLHGGITATIADEAAWHAIETRFGYGARKSTTTELKVNYLRPIVGKKAIARV